MVNSVATTMAAGREGEKGYLERTMLALKGKGGGLRRVVGGEREKALKAIGAMG